MKRFLMSQLLNVFIALFVMILFWPTPHLQAFLMGLGGSYVYDLIRYVFSRW